MHAALIALLTYGPVLGRGRTPDSVIVRWGTSTSAPTRLDVQLAGSATPMTLPMRVVRSTLAPVHG